MATSRLQQLAARVHVLAPNGITPPAKARETPQRHRHGVKSSAQCINPLTDAHKPPPLSLCYRSIGREEGRRGPLHRGEKLPCTDDITTQLASPLLHSRRPTLLNDSSKSSFAWHQRKAKLPFHKEARPAALLVAHHQKVGIGKLQDKTHCPHSTALLLECNPSLPRYPVTNLTNAITLPQKTVPRRQRRAVWPLRAHGKGSLNALYRCVLKINGIRIRPFINHDGLQLSACASSGN